MTRHHLRRDGKWVQVTAAEFHAARPPSPVSGIRNPVLLGDLVAAVATPIARAIDRVAGTDLQNCGGCRQRKDWLNRLGQ